MLMQNRFITSVIIFVVCILGGVAAYMIIATLLKIPSQKSVDTLIKSYEGNKEKVAFEELAKSIAKTKLIKIDKYKREDIERALDVAEDRRTPEEYTAAAIVMGGVAMLVASVLLFISKPLGLVAMALGPILGYIQYKEIFNKLKKHRAAIEREIPRFAQTIHENLKVSRDILSIFQSYKSIAGKSLKFELEKTIADMKTSNYEAALLRFDARVGSPNLSELVRGLVGALRGNDQTAYFEHFAYEMRHYEENMIRKEAMKRPDKMHFLSMAMLGGVLVMVAAVCGTLLIEGFSMFGGAI